MCLITKKKNCIPQHTHTHIYALKVIVNASAKKEGRRRSDSGGGGSWSRNGEDPLTGALAGRTAATRKKKT